MAGNVVEILVKSRDKTKDGFSSANKGASSFGDKMKQVNRVAVGASLAIGAGLLVWGKHTATALGRIEKLSAQTESAVRSMGVSWTSTKEIEAYSAELERLTGVEAETIQEGQNLLLTFGQIQNRVGEGNDIFNQATRAVTDMSVALGQDTKSSAIQLGKALNDPIKGVTALQRVGVSFTASQKEQISALVESGKTMEAQKLILGELTRQFGGSAEAFGETMPGQVAKLKNSFGELSESLLTALMPAFQSIMGLLAEFAAWALENQGAVMAIGAVFLGLAAAVLTVNAAVKVWQAGVVIATAVQWLWNIAMTANPIGIIIVAIAAFVAAIIILWNKSEGFRNFFIKMWGHIKGIAIGVGRAIARDWNKLLDFFRGVPGKIGGFFAGVGDAIARPFVAAFNWIRNLWNSTVGGFGFTVPSWIPAVGGKSFRLPFMAHGGIGGGLAMVGERGRELVRLPQGSQVIPNGTTEAMMARGGGGGRTVIEIRSGGSRLDDLLVELLRKAVKVRGGDVQFVLGRS